MPNNQEAAMKETPPVPVPAKKGIRAKAAAWVRSRSNSLNSPGTSFISESPPTSPGAVGPEVVVGRRCSLTKDNKLLANHENHHSFDVQAFMDAA